MSERATVRANEITGEGVKRGDDDDDGCDAIEPVGSIDVMSTRPRWETDEGRRRAGERGGEDGDDGSV